MLTFGSLFAGIGGLDLGLERAGMRCVFQVEIDPYARRVLEKHWPHVRRHDDVKTFPPTTPEEWGCDLICGGFPCQDISCAGQRAGIEGQRSGLWAEFARIVRLVRPRYVLVENVAALLTRGMDRVLADLAECGYDAEWDCLPAAAFGAVHIRNRLFLLAYSAGIRCQQRQHPRNLVPEAADQPEYEQGVTTDGAERGRADVHDPMCRRYRLQEETIFAGRGGIELSSWWQAEPSVGRVADGVPARVDRIRCLGNAVVPQVSEWIGRRILAYEVLQAVETGRQQPSLFSEDL